MALFHILSFISCYLGLFYQTVDAAVIEAYKPTKKTTAVQSSNSGSGNFDELSYMMKRLEHKIDDIDVRQKIMEAQKRSPFALISYFTGMAPGFPKSPIIGTSIIYSNARIYSGSGAVLQIFENGTVSGTKDDTSPYARLTLEVVAVGADFKIKGEKSQKYLVCRKSGKFSAVSKPKKIGDDVFESKPVNCKGRPGKKLGRTCKFYVNIKCANYRWYLGYRHNYQLKKGRHVRLNQLDSAFFVNI